MTKTFETISRIKALSLRSAKLLGSFPERYRKEEDGVAAIEFALIAPVMIAFYFGLSEISMVITADRNTAHTASVAGDLATQVIELDKAGVQDVMTATLAVMNIDADERMNVTVELNSYRISPITSAVERIGYARMGPQISNGGPVTFNPASLNSNMLNATSGAVVARVNYKYKPVTYTFVKDVTLHETFVLKPRKSLSVPFKDGPAGLKRNFSCTANQNMKATCSSS